MDVNLLVAIEPLNEKYCDSNCKYLETNQDSVRCLLFNSKLEKHETHSNIFTRCDECKKLGYPQDGVQDNTEWKPPFSLSSKVKKTVLLEDK